MKHRIKDELQGVGIFLAVIWLIFLIDFMLATDLCQWGVVSRSASGLVGILTMPFLHGNWQHLVGNSVPLVVLLCLLAGSRANSVGIVVAIIVIGGALLWLIGPAHKVTVGASGLIYGLITFLITAGVTERRPMALTVAVVVGILYGTTLFSGILPFTVGDGVSWQGHLTGAVAGILLGRFAVEPAKHSSKPL